MAARRDITVDDEELEEFEINQFDLESAWNPTKRQRMSKNKQTYGVWAEDSDEEPESRAGFGGKRRGPKDYSAPVNFVSGGIKTGDKIKKEEENEDAASEGEDEVGVILSRAYEMKTAKAGPSGRRGGKGGTSGGGGRMLDQMMAGMRGGKEGTDPKRFADWERHTKGIGAKLLNRMGYEHGKGLGKEGAGIVEPVSAALRPGRGAVGAYGPEANRPKLGQEQADEAMDQSAGAEGKATRKGGWKKAGAQSRQEVEYKTAEELITEGGGRLKAHLDTKGHGEKTKVIDMTGKQQRVYTGYNAFSSRTRDPNEGEGEGRRESHRRFYDIPELMYNLDILIDMTEEDIIKNDRMINHLKDQNVHLEHEEERLSKDIEAEEKQVNRTQELIALIEKYGESGGNVSKMSLEECKDLFSTLQVDFYEEYKIHGLGSLATTTVLPALKQHFVGWEPLDDPERGLDVMKEWRGILEESPHDWTLRPPPSPETMEPYHRLIWEAWLPQLRRAVLDHWKPRESESLLHLLESWQPIVPGWIFNNILEQLILPRLQSEVHNWNPCSDHVPIHCWLHPWLPLMSDRLQVLYGSIRQKLGRALNEGAGWHPSDKSAKSILKPWIGVFTPGAISGFISRHILPRLELCVETWVVDPSNQDLRPWDWIMDWLDMVSPNLIAQLLLHHFSPKWHKALHTWLSSVNPNYNEITSWYIGWKGLFPQSLLDLQLIKEQFRHALEVMNRAVSGGWAPTGAKEEIAYLSANERVRLMQQSKQQHARDMELLSGGSSSVPTSFKDLVEKRAEENELDFLPVVNKFREGKQVYRFGSQQIYVDRNVLFVHDPQNGSFAPISIEKLISRAKK